MMTVAEPTPAARLVYLPLRCTACGSPITPTLEYRGGTYREHRDHTGYECDECPAAWDKNGKPTPPERVAYEGMDTAKCVHCGGGIFEPYCKDHYPWLHVGGWRYCPRLPDEDQPSRVATPATSEPEAEALGLALIRGADRARALAEHGTQRADRPLEDQPEARS